jgi:dipeptidyl aminopeptidase/acylaminoacyl peptidase
MPEPCLLYHAERDDRCPIGQTEEFYAALKARGQDVTFVRYPDETHVGLWLGSKPSFRVDVVRRVNDWFLQEL